MEDAQRRLAGWECNDGGVPEGVLLGLPPGVDERCGPCDSRADGAEDDLRLFYRQTGVPAA